MLLVTPGQSQQLKFYTNQGKQEVKQAGCQTKDLMVKVPIPANASGYDKVRFFVFRTSNAASESQAVYQCVWDKEDLKGKTEMMVVLKSEDNVNEFHYGGYGINWGNPTGSGSALKMDEPCADESRTDQIWKISFELEGMKLNRVDYIPGITTGVKYPIYNLNTLKKWPDALPYDYGKVDMSFYSSDRSFSVKKVYSVTYNGKTLDMPAEISVQDAELYARLGSGMMTITSFPTSKMSVEDVKQDLIKRIKKSTLASVKANEEPKESWPLNFCYPCYSKKLKKAGIDEYDNAMAEECTNKADWKPAKISGNDGFVFLTNRGLLSELFAWSFDEQKAVADNDGVIRWQSVHLFVVEHKGKVFVGIGTNTSDKKSSEYLPKFYNDVMESLKLY